MPLMDLLRAEGSTPPVTRRPNSRGGRYVEADRRRHRCGGIAIVTPQNRITHARTPISTSPVLLDGPPPFHESVVEAAWLVELFVPNEASLLRACEQDQGGAEPTTVGTIHPRWILLMIECQDKLLTGPGDRGHSECRAINYRLEGQP